MHLYIECVTETKNNTICPHRKRGEIVLMAGEHGFCFAHRLHTGNQAFQRIHILRVCVVWVIILNGHHRRRTHNICGFGA
jgi:hypothetical protein